MAWPGWDTYTPPPHGGGETRRSKYQAVPHVVLANLLLIPESDAPRPHGGLRFASKREAERFLVLRVEQERGAITELTLQRAYDLHVVRPDGVTVAIGRYLADFTYQRSGQTVVEDAKGMRTALYRWKQKHAEAEHGMVIHEV